MVSLLLRR